MTAIKRLRPFQRSRENIPVETILAGQKTFVMGKRFAQIEGTIVTKRHHWTVFPYSARHKLTMISPKNSSCQRVSFPSDIRKRRGM